MTVRVQSLCALVLLSCLISNPAHADTPWERYYRLPSAENAAQVSKLSYSSGTIPAGWGYDARHLDVLSVQVVAGDAEALRLALRFLPQADGGLLEDLEELIGRSIRPHPELFLAEVARSTASGTLESILRMAGLVYTDLERAHYYELEMRRRAIAAVVDPSLAQERERCLSILDRVLKPYGEPTQIEP